MSKEIKEGNVKKGGVNPFPTSPRPPGQPAGQRGLEFYIPTVNQIDPTKKLKINDEPLEVSFKFHHDYGGYWIILVNGEPIKTMNYCGYKLREMNMIFKTKFDAIQYVKYKGLVN